MIHLETRDDVLTVTIDLQDKANALTRAMLEEVGAAAQGAPAGLRAFALRGAGRVFSGGADLDEARAGLAWDPLWAEVSTAIADLPCLTIAALNGTVAGGALGLTLACDIRIAVPGAKAFYPVMRLGFTPPAPDPGRLIALIGPARARMILLAGQKIDAAEALSWGLFDRLVAPEEMDAALDALTADARAATAEQVARIKAATRV